MSKKNKSKKGILLASLVAIAGFFGIVATSMGSAAGEAIITVNTPGTQFEVGETVNTTISVEPGDDSLSVITVAVEYDPEYLEPVAGSVVGERPMAGAVMGVEDLDAGGAKGYHYFLASSNPADPSTHMTQQSVLLTAQFRAIKEGQTDISIYDEDRATYATTYKDGDIKHEVPLRFENSTIDIASSGPDGSAPSVPTNLMASLGSDDVSALLSWNASNDPDSGVSRYDIFVDGGTTPIGNSNSTSYTATGLAPGTEYSFTVTAVNGDGLSSEQSAPVTITTPSDNSGVEAPTDASLSSTLINDDEAVRIDWGASDGAAGYNIYIDSGSATTKVNDSLHTSTSYEFSDLAPETTYSYRVAAVDDDGAEYSTTTKTFTTPAAPTPDGGVTFKLIPSVTGPLEKGQQFDVSIILDNPYERTISAYDIALNIDEVMLEPFNIDTVTTEAYCSENNGYGSPLVPMSDANYFLPCSFISSADHFSDSSVLLAKIRLVAGQQNGEVRIEPSANSGFIRAMDENNDEIEASAAALVMQIDSQDPEPQPPQKPVSLSVESKTTNRVTIAWTNPGGTIDKYVVQRAGSDGEFSTIGEVSSPTVKYVDGGLEESTQYFYRVKAVNEDGESGYTNPLPVTTNTSVDPEPTDTEKPTAPSNLTASTNTSSANLTWTPSTDNTGVIGYSLLIYTASPNEYIKQFTLGGNANSADITGLSPGAGYRVTLVAYDAAGNKSPVVAKTFFTEANPVTPTNPTTPTTPTPSPAPTPTPNIPVVITPSVPTPEDLPESEDQDDDDADGDEPQLTNAVSFDADHTSVKAEVDGLDQFDLDDGQLYMVYGTDDRFMDERHGIQDANGFEIEGFTPGETYFTQLVYIDKDGNEQKGKIQSFKTTGYTVEIEVVDTDESVIKNLDITFYSIERTATTNDQGIAIIEDVSPGRHDVVFNYQGKEHRSEVIIDDTVANGTDDPSDGIDNIRERVSVDVSAADASSAGSSWVRYIGYLIMSLLVILAIILGLRLYKNNKVNDGSNCSQ